MIITLGEGDSFLHNGETKNIIIHVTFENGKKIQFPYVASKTLSELYSDVENFSDEKIVASPITPIPVIVSQAATVPLAVAAPPITGNEEIGREDLVKCVKVEDRGRGATVDISVGGIYRVLQVKGTTIPIDGKMTRIVDGYDVIDDKAPIQRRIAVLAHEVVFYQKRKQPIPKIAGKIEHRSPCPTCRADMILYKEDTGIFKGTCQLCGTETEKELKNEQPTTPKTQDINTGTT